MNVPSPAVCCAGLYELPLTRLLLGSSFHPGGLELTERLARSVALGPDDQVLDVASGRGDTALHLASNYGCQVVGLEFSASQVEEATARAESRGLADRVRFVCGDASKLPFDDQRFDVAFCECALCTFSERGMAIREIKRVLRRGGLFAVSDVLLEVEPPRELRDVLGHVLCIAGALSKKGYQEALVEGGFERVKYRDATESLGRLVDQMKKRAARVEDWESPELGWVSRDRVGKELSIAEGFVRERGLGYATFTARAVR